MAAPDLAASASIPSGKKNSRGARHLRQIEVNSWMLTQVRCLVTERRRMDAVQADEPDGIRARANMAEFVQRRT